MFPKEPPPYSLNLELCDQIRGARARGGRGSVRWKRFPEVAYQVLAESRRSGLSVARFSAMYELPAGILRLFPLGLLPGGRPWPELQRLLEERGLPESMSVQKVPVPTDRVRVILDTVAALGNQTRAAEALGISRQRVSQVCHQFQQEGIDFEVLSRLRALFREDPSAQRWLPKLKQEERQCVEQHIIQGDPVPKKTYGWSFQLLMSAEPKLQLLHNSGLQETELLQAAEQCLSEDGVDLLREYLSVGSLLKLHPRKRGFGTKLRLLGHILDLLARVEPLAPAQVNAVRLLLPHPGYLPRKILWIERMVRDAPRIHQIVKSARTLVGSLRNDKGMIYWSKYPTEATLVVRALRESGIPIHLFVREVGVNEGSLRAWLKGNNVYGRPWVKLRALADREIVLEPDPLAERARSLIEPLRYERRIVWRQDLAAVLAFLDVWRSSGLSPAEFAARVHISPTTFGRLLHGMLRFGEWPELKQALPPFEPSPKAQHFLERAQKLRASHGARWTARCGVRLRLLCRESGLGVWLFFHMLGVPEGYRSWSRVKGRAKTVLPRL